MITFDEQLRHVPQTCRGEAVAYLDAVREALPDVSVPDREDLLADLAAHIDEAFAQDQASCATSPTAALRGVLDDLGPVSEVAASARAADPEPASAPDRTMRDANSKRYDALALLALAVGFVVIPVAGWLVGVAMLWFGPRWTTADRVLGTALWPVLLAVPMTGATAFPKPAGNVVGLVGLGLVLLVWAPFVLVRLARRSALFQEP